MTQTTKLFGFCLSSASYRVRIALNYKGIPFELQSINLMKGENNTSEEFKKISPFKHVPVLLIDNKLLFESTAIIEYLEETRPENPLLPKDAYKRAQSRMISQLVNSGIQPLQNQKIGPHLKEKYNGTLEEWRLHWIPRGLDALEKALGSTRGRYCIGDEFTMADCLLAPQVFAAEAFKVPLSDYPNIREINANLLQHAAVAKAHPKVQPDFPMK